MKLVKHKIEFENGVVQERYLIPSNIEYFTEKSPLGMAIKSGVMELPSNQGGKLKVKITPIKNEKINEEFLREQGFVDSGEKHGYNIIWRKPIGEDSFFQFTMGNYPETNPNVGVLGIYYPERDVKAIPKDLVSKEQWSDEDEIRASNYTIKFEKQFFNFAFWLDDRDRFKRLIEDISFSRELTPSNETN